MTVNNLCFHAREVAKEIDENPDLATIMLPVAKEWLVTTAKAADFRWYTDPRNELAYRRAKQIATSEIGRKYLTEYRPMVKNNGDAIDKAQTLAEMVARHFLTEHRTLQQTFAGLCIELFLISLTEEERDAFEQAGIDGCLPLI